MENKSCILYEGISFCQNEGNCSTCKSPKAEEKRLKEVNKLCLSLLEETVPYIEEHNARKAASKKTRTHKHKEFVLEVIRSLEPPKTLRKLILELRRYADQADHPIVKKVIFEGGDPKKAEIHWHTRNKCTRGKTLEEFLTTEKPDLST